MLQVYSTGSGNVILTSRACSAGTPALRAHAGPAVTWELPHSFGAALALFTNVGKRPLKVRAAGSALLALAHIFLHVSVLSPLRQYFAKL